MKSLICKSCGGMLRIDGSAMTAVCAYCGQTYILDHQDTDYYQSFFAQMSQFFSGSPDEQERKKRADCLWDNASEVCFRCQDGTPVSIRYMHCYIDGDSTVYVARKYILLHFRKENASNAEKFRRVVSSLDYPTADTRGLSDHFPKINGGYVLEDGGYLLVVCKDEDEYPLHLFGTLPHRHVAWLISRLENICCVLEFNSLVHPRISPYTVYINPYTHQASLYGGWWSVVKNNSVSTEIGRTVITMDNLKGLRLTAANMLGAAKPELLFQNNIPPALQRFIKCAPRFNAYEDFAYWDETLMQAYGERKFVNLDTDDERVYGK